MNPHNILHSFKIPPFREDQIRSEAKIGIVLKMVE